MAEPPSSTGSVDTATEVLGGARPVEPVKEQRAPLLGRVLGKFTVVERLGRGGSGEVFRAEQAQLGRSAVIKVLRSDLAPSPHRVERFLREARLASTLDHPYAAHIYAFGAEPDGLLWIAMEHVRGTTLDEVIARRGPMPPVVFAPLFERLCEVVHSAHELGIVHRDIKLANVMVIERSGQLLPKLLDFGIAKAQGADDVISPGADGGTITGHGATIGSPPYMAPEQWQRPHDVDGRADIYALGVLAYRCLSGRPPIPGATRAELAHNHLHVEPALLGVGPLALDEAIRRALAKSPDKRWPRALDFSAAVRKAVGAGAGEAVPLLDGMVRDVWERGGPQPIAEAVARVAAAATTVECDDAVRDLVDVTCRWLAAIALAGCKPEHLHVAMAAPPAAPSPLTPSEARSAESNPSPLTPSEARSAESNPSPLTPSEARSAESNPSPLTLSEARSAESKGAAGPAPIAAPALDRPTPSPFARPRRPSTSGPGMQEAATVIALRDRARDLAKQDDAVAWLAVARAACAVTPAVPELPAVLAAATTLDALAGRYTVAHGGRRGRTAGDLAADVAALADALAPLDPLLAYRLVVGGEEGPETWVGARQRSRPRALVWGDAVAVGEVVLLDGAGHIALRLSPLVRAQRPLPHGDLELFLIARTGRGVARLAATPWGFEHDDEEAGRFLAQLSTADSQSSEDVDDEASPYPGLAAYGVDDADRFFGREREVDQLANRLVRAPMVAVVGPSGVGKSSFVHAGLVGRLRETYRVITLRPGRHPTEALHAAIEREAATAATVAEAPPRPDGTVPGGRRFPADDAELADRLRALGERAARGVVVIIDQLEEVTTLCADAADRDRFARVLGAAAAGSTSPVRVVATLRDDFASLLESIDGFRDHYEVFVLGAPSPDALRRILIEPARRAGVGLEAGLVDDIVTEITGRAAALPLLGFTAARLWQLRDRDRRELTRSAYQALGGVAGALATYADEVFASLGKREQGVARDVFARLVAADGTRVPMPRTELAAIDGGSGVIERLVEARLLTTREADADRADRPDRPDPDRADPDDDLIEIVHECLAERWPRLVRWRSEDAADRALVTDLRTAARRWEDQHRPDDLLWRGAVLVDLRRLVERTQALTARERTFATASLAAARRRVRLRRGALVAVLVGFAAIAGVMAYLMKLADENATHAADSERSARTAAALAEARLTHQLRSAGQRELVEGRPANALAYLGEVLRRGLDDDGIRLMVGQTAWAWPYERVDRPGDMLATATEDGSWFVVGQDHVHWKVLDGTGAEVGALDLGSFTGSILADRAGKRALMISDTAVEVAPIHALDQRRTVLRTQRTDEVFTGCFGPGADEVTVTYGRGEVRVYGVDGTLRRKLPTGMDTINQWECSPDGSHLMIGTPTRTVLVDLHTMKLGFDSTTNFIAGDFADDGTFVVDTIDGQLEVHAPDGALRARWRTTSGPHLVFLQPDATRVAIASDHQIELRRIADGAVDVRMGGFRGGIASLEFADDELWSGGNDGMVRRWRADGLQVAALMSLGGNVYDVIRTPTGVAAVSERGVRFWDGRPSQVETAGTSQCVADYFLIARDRPTGLIICSEGTIELWDFDTGKTAVIRDGREALGVALDPAGRRVASWVWNGDIRFWTDQGERIGEHEVEQELMAAAWVGGELWVVGFVSGAHESHDLVANLTAIEPATGATRKLAWAPTEGIVSMLPFGADAAVAFDQTGVVTALRDGTPVARVETGLTPPATAFAPLFTVAAGGGFVAASGAQGVIKIYALPGLTEIHRIESPGVVMTMALDRDGKTLVTVSPDRRAVVWSVATGEALTQLALGEIPILEAQFSANPDELFVYAGDHLSRVKLPRAIGTTADLAAEIGCRVPLRPEGGTLVPTTPTCPKQ